jgi:hypothetical protein
MAAVSKLVSRMLLTGAGYEKMPDSLATAANYGIFSISDW